MIWRILITRRLCPKVLQEMHGRNIGKYSNLSYVRTMNG